MSSVLDDLGLDPGPTPPDRTALERQRAWEAQRKELQPITVTLPPAVVAQPRFRLLTAADLLELPGFTWAMQSVLPAAGVAGVFGPSRSGKSFLTLDMAAFLALGEPWFGYRVKRCCRVVYIALEGEAGFLRRIKAWEAEHCRAFPDSVRFVFQAFSLTTREDVLALAAAIDEAGGADVIVIDTLNRAAPGVDENSSRDASLVLEGVRELQGMTGGLAVLVHHVGKDASKGMRGHSSLFAALDAAIEVTRTEDRREWRVAKVKDDRDGAVHAFQLHVVDLGCDDDGEPMTSCVVRHPDAETQKEAPDEPRVKVPKGGNQRIVYDALGPLLRASHAFGKGGAPAIRPCITLDEAIDGTKDRLTVEPKRRGERARQALTGLIATGVLGHNEGWVWLK